MATSVLFRVRTAGKTATEKLRKIFASWLVKTIEDIPDRWILPVKDSHSDALAQIEVSGWQLTYQGARHLEPQDLAYKVVDEMRNQFAPGTQFAVVAMVDGAFTEILEIL